MSLGGGQLNQREIFPAVIVLFEKCCGPKDVKLYSTSGEKLKKD